MRFDLPLCVVFALHEHPVGRTYKHLQSEQGYTAICSVWVGEHSAKLACLFRRSHCRQLCIDIGG